MNTTLIIGSTFNDPLQKQTVFTGPLNVSQLLLLVLDAVMDKLSSYTLKTMQMALIEIEPVSSTLIV